MNGKEHFRLVVISMILYVLCLAMGLAATCYLVSTGHPWFGAGTLGVVAFLRFHWEDKDDEKKEAVNDQHS